MDGEVDKEYVRGQDGIWRINENGRKCKVDRNGVRWTKVRLREGGEVKRPPDVTVRNWHSRFSKIQKKTFNKCRNKHKKRITPQYETSEPTGGGDVCEGTQTKEIGGVGPEHYRIDTPESTPRNLKKRKTQEGKKCKQKIGNRETQDPRMITCGQGRQKIKEN